MRRRPLFTTLAAAGLLATLGTAPVASAAPAAARRAVHSCAAPARGLAACNAILAETVTAGGVVVNPSRAPHSAVVSGYGPGSLDAAYSLPSATAGAGQTVGIVDAYNDPTAAADLAVYRSHFGLPACTTSSGCLRIVNQAGGTSLPAKNGGWAQEISLDLDMVSAICPSCKILLVEAKTASLTNLGTAVNEAAALGANAISNSYGGSESSSDPTYDSRYYDHPGVAVTASSGDGGYGVEYPAAGAYVTAVGGTSLYQSGSTYTQTAWSGSGSGCSAYDAQPAWQASLTAITSVCKQRAVADVSAVADPNTGVAVYDSTTYGGASGWLVFGGTSVASPIIASTYALAGNASSAGGSSAYVYAHSSGLSDVSGGSNGTCGNQLCQAGAGWDGPTGLGTPNGTSAF